MVNKDVLNMSFMEFCFHFKTATKEQRSDDNYSEKMNQILALFFYANVTTAYLPWF